MNKKMIQFGLAGVAVAAFIGVVTNVIVDERLEDFESVVALQQERQRGVLSVIAETTARNGADAVTESIVRDCTTEQRTRFDTLLGELDSGLSRGELVELERLFASCGSFFSERKSLMVARMEREYDLYVDYTDQLEAITGDELQEAAQIEAWGDLVRFEKQQDQYFSSLVELQEKIIGELLDGNTNQSEEIISILAEVREARENLTLASTQAATVRSEVLAL
jgi:hypothetical protein